MQNKKQKGITLIALIITIVILLIIATVTIDVAIDGKLFDTAKDAVDKTNDRVSQAQAEIDEIMSEWEKLEGSGTGGEIPDTTPPEGEIIINKVTKESISITVKARDLESGLAESGTFAYYLNSENTARENSIRNTYTYINLEQNTEYEIRVKIKDTAGNEKEVITTAKTEEGIVTAAVIDQNPTLYYGKEVENYGVIYDDTEGESNKWRIFYADEDNIYLITDDYIHYNYVPESANYTLDRNTDYQLDFSDVYQDYTGAVDIDSTLGNKWLSAYWPSNQPSTYTHIRTVAYMLDTEIWNPIYKNDYAEYAIGGPTIEMFCASYKDTHKSNYIEYKGSSQGYEVRWNGDSSYDREIEDLTVDVFNSIYINSSASKALGMWLASPSSVDPNCVMCVFFGGYASYYSPTRNFEFYLV